MHGWVDAPLFPNSSKDGGWGGRCGAKLQKDPEGMTFLIPTGKRQYLCIPRVGTVLGNRFEARGRPREEK